MLQMTHLYILKKSQRYAKNIVTIYNIKQLTKYFLRFFSRYNNVKRILSSKKN